MHLPYFPSLGSGKHQLAKVNNYGTLQPASVNECVRYSMDNIRYTVSPLLSLCFKRSLLPFPLCSTNFRRKLFPSAHGFCYVFLFFFFLLLQLLNNFGFGLPFSGVTFSIGISTASGGFSCICRQKPHPVLGFGISSYLPSSEPATGPPSSTHTFFVTLISSDWLPQQYLATKLWNANQIRTDRIKQKQTNRKINFGEKRTALCFSSPTLFRKNNSVVYATPGAKGRRGMERGVWKRNENWWMGNQSRSPRGMPS